MKVVKNIDIYLTSKRPVRTIDVVQYDTGIQLVFTAKDFTIPDGSSATLYVRKPSGRFVYQNFNITVAINTITIDLENQALTEYGEIPYQVSIENGSDTVTTFTGMMIVQPSLKDSGAIKSGTVVRAFDELTAEKLAEFQVRAETAASGVIATIPEDYTAMTAKVNESANAIKGHLSGAVVRADDVSPVEHLPVVKVRGKNYCKTNEITVTGDYPWANKFLDEVIHLKTGKYTFSCDFVQTGTETQVSYSVRESDSELNSISSKSSKETSGSIVDTFEVKKDTDVKLVMYCNITANEIDTACTFSNIQLEAGTERTEFNEWLDPSTTTLACRGKNILPITSMLENQTYTGVTVKRVGNTFIFNGTATDDCILFNSAFCRYGGAGNSFALSVDHLAGTMNGTASACVGDSYTDTEARNSWANVSLKTADNSYAYTMQKNFIKDMWFYVRAGTVFSSYSIRVQLEKGSKATDYENYKCVEYTPNADGTIDGLTSVSPTMTLLTDTEGVTIECEYNKDTNKVISKLVNAISAMGGEVTI